MLIMAGYSKRWTLCFIDGLITNLLCLPPHCCVCFPSAALADKDRAWRSAISRDSVESRHNSCKSTCNVAWNCLSSHSGIPQLGNLTPRSSLSSAFHLALYVQIFVPNVAQYLVNLVDIVKYWNMYTICPLSAQMWCSLHHCTLPSINKCGESSREAFFM